MKYLLKIITAWALFVHVTSCNAQTLTAGEFESGITKDSVQILDVRTAGEYSTGHIKGAMLADWNNKEEFKRRVAFIDKNKPVYVYCLVGGRSAAAAEKMRAEGFEKVFELKGGINAWKADSKPLEGKTTVRQMSIDEFNRLINSSKAVLVDFGAVWCPPCKKMGPVLKSLESNNPGKFSLVKVDGGNDEEIMKAYNVTTLPVFILFKDGKQVWRKDGVAEEKEIADQL